MNPITGELSEFDGHHVFRKYESLIVTDDRTGRKAVKGLGNIIDSDFIFTLDFHRPA